MNTVQTAYDVSPRTIGLLIAVVAAMYVVALVVVVLRVWPTAAARLLPLLAVTALLLFVATPADAGTRYMPNGCARDWTSHAVQYTYMHSIPLPDGERICRYSTMRKLPLLGWWPGSTVSRWAR